MKTETTYQETQELLTSVRQGEQASFARLISLYSPLIEAEVANRSQDLSREDVEDLRQVALLALYRAALGFDLSKNEVTFGLYAKICIVNALASEIRVLKRHQAELPLAEVPDVALVDHPATRLMEQEALTATQARICALLSSFELRVWTLYVAGYRSGEIARQLEKDTHSIENAVYRIRQKLRKAFGEKR